MQFVTKEELKEELLAVTKYCEELINKAGKKSKSVEKREAVQKKSKK